MKAHADLCLHCKLCRSECPSAVDVSSLMIEAKAAHVERHGLPPSDWIFSRLEMWARLGSRFPILTNFLMTRRWARAVLERLLGVSRHRVLPRVRRSPFTRRAARLGWIVRFAAARSALRATTLNCSRAAATSPFVRAASTFFNSDLISDLIARFRSRARRF